MQINFREKFWSRIQVGNPAECWEWLGAKTSGGYGQVRFQNRRQLTHRVAWQLERGPIPDCVLHKCDNPPCCNLNHLFLGSIADNNADKAAKGRSNTTYVPPRPVGPPPIHKKAHLIDPKKNRNDLIAVTVVGTHQDILAGRWTIVMSAKEAADYLGVSRVSLHYLRGNGHISSFGTANGGYYYRKIDLEAYREIRSKRFK